MFFCLKVLLFFVCFDLVHLVLMGWFLFLTLGGDENVNLYQYIIMDRKIYRPNFGV